MRSYPAVLAALGLVAGLAGTRPSLGQAAPDVPPLVLENFEACTVGARPYLWKEGKHQAQMVEIGAERTALDGDDANKALKYDYNFDATFDAADGVEAGPLNQSLPGSLSGLSLMVHSDGSKNAMAVRFKDRLGESFEWRVPLTWMGWQKITLPLNPATALKSGSRANGMLDYPMTFEVVRVARLPAGARKGSMMVDNLTAHSKFGKVITLYDTAAGVHPELWKANRNRATIGLLADSLVPRNGKDQSVLKMEYEYEGAADASVEFQRTIPVGAPGHGTLIAEVYGDGSNNVVRFRMLDAADAVWSATWTSILVDWSGWKTLYLDTRLLRQPTGPDPTAAPDKLPLKFHSIILDDCSASDALPGVESGRKGEVFLGRLLFGAE
jgi:hypothetical protein